MPCCSAHVATAVPDPRNVLMATPCTDAKFLTVSGLRTSVNASVAAAVPTARATAGAAPAMRALKAATAPVSERLPGVEAAAIMAA